MPRQLYANAAERQAAYRARHKTRTLTVEIPEEIFEGLNAYLKFKNLTKNEVITKLIEHQLLRKR